jgi:hypothetical protein
MRSKYLIVCEITQIYAATSALSRAAQSKMAASAI